MAFGGDAVAVLQRLVDGGQLFILVDAPADTLLALSDSVKGKDVLLFNVRAEDEELRQERCRANVLHTAPDRYMLADALAQYLVWKRWQRWLVVKGPFPEDVACLEAIRRAAKRFGGTIVEEREYKETPGARRSDTGQLQVQRQMPVLTQGAPSYDVLIVADEREVFGPYLPFRTYDPRPVAGTAVSSQRAGTLRMSNGAQRKCRTASSVSPSASCGPSIIGVDRGPRHRRGDNAGSLGGVRTRQRTYPQQGPQPRSLQGTEGHLQALGRADAAADPHQRPRSSGLDVAAGRLSA